MKHHLLFLICALLLMSGAQAKETPSSGVVDAQLVNGDTQCSGHLEIKHQGQWRALKIRSNHHSSLVGFGEMACRQMGCGSATSVQFHPNVTEPRPAWEVPFSCHGTDLTIQQCNKRASGKKVASVESYVSSMMVVCAGILRTDDACTGTVKLKSDQDWVYICLEDTTRVDPLMAEIMCAELGCGTVKQAISTNQLTAVPSRSVRCVGNETQLQQCPVLAHSDCRSVLWLNCDNPYSLRVTGGDSKCRGILEGKNGVEWRPVTSGWRTFSESRLSNMCEKMGCGSLLSSTAHYTQDYHQLWELDPECGSSSRSCKKWSHREARTLQNISCAEAVRLVRSHHRCTGYVEVKYNGSWMNLCRDDFSLFHGFVACRDLGCGFPQHFPPSDPKGTVYNTLNISCSGSEERLVDCPVSSLPAEGSGYKCIPASVMCDNKPMEPEMSMFSRLATAGTKLLTVYRGHPVLVGCGITSPSPVNSFKLEFNSHSLTVLLENKTAVDYSAHFLLDAAEQSQEGYYYCSYDYELSPGTFSKQRRFGLRIKAASYVRLDRGEGRCLGRLELEHKGEWRPVSQQLWGPTEAAVVCRQLGCGSVVHTHTQSSVKELQPVWRFYSDCEGSERALLSCGSVREGMSKDTVHVICSDIVAPPTLTVLTDRLYPEDTEQVLVPEDHSVFVNCSVEARFPGGHFALLFSGASKTTMSQTSSNYSAIFFLQNVNKSHSGNYSCVYYNSVYQRNFTFQSKTVTITVEESRDIMLDDGQQRDDGAKACSGTLFMKKGASRMKMVTAETSSWDLKHASIVCKQLGCGEAVSTSKIKLQTFESMWRFFSDCAGPEAALLDCGYIDEWFSPTAIQVVCVGKS